MISYVKSNFFCVRSVPRPLLIEIGGRSWLWEGRLRLSRSDQLTRALRLGSRLSLIGGFTTLPWKKIPPGFGAPVLPSAFDDGARDGVKNELFPIVQNFAVHVPSHVSSPSILRILLEPVGLLSA